VTKIKFHDPVKIIVDADVRALGIEPLGKGAGILARKFPGKWWKKD